MNPFPLRIVTPTREVWSGDVEHVRMPGVEGHFGVLSGHAPFLSILDIGAGQFRAAGTTRTVAITGGYAEVLPEGVTVIARTAEFVDEIDISRAEKALKRSAERIHDLAKGVDHDRARRAHARAQLRVNLAHLAGK